MDGFAFQSGSIAYEGTAIAGGLLTGEEHRAFFAEATELLDAYIRELGRELEADSREKRTHEIPFESSD